MNCTHRRNDDRSHTFSASKHGALCVLIVMTICFGTGCASYSAKSIGRADFRAMGITEEQADAQTDISIAKRLERKPLAAFPTAIAVVRVQEHGYCSPTARGFGHGNFSVVTTRDVEPDDAFTKIATLPMVEGVAPLNKLVLPANLQSEEHLRQGAANVQADMLLIYTFDTVFTSDKKMAPLGVVTLGLFPDRTARVTSTASAALVDTRNGYVYGLAEATGRESQLTNAWNSKQAVDDARRNAERHAFENLAKEFPTMWQGVVDRYGPGRTSAQKFAAD